MIRAHVQQTRLAWRVAEAAKDDGPEALRGTGDGEGAEG